MSHFEDLPDHVSVPLEPDAEGYVGRECPAESCQRYFKITPGTGLEGNDLPCYCPYCGHKAGGDHFLTTDQVTHVQSVAINLVTTALLDYLRDSEFDSPPSGPFDFGISMKVEGEPEPVQYYKEKRLETEVVCDRCTLRYAIYGVFGFCPDCGVHNSLQILRKNLDLAEKEICLAASVDGDLADRLISGALTNSVAAFDGFGRETCRVYSPNSVPSRPIKISFQNLSGARTNVQEQFGFDMASDLTPEEWRLACRCFQKRHLLAHKLGVVDQDYLRATNDPESEVGRKVSITPEQVMGLIATLHKLGASLIACVRRAT